MDFDLGIVRCDAIRMKEHIKCHGFESLDYLGGGRNGDVYGYGSAAAKRQLFVIGAPLEKIFEKYIMESEKGIKRGIHFAPYLDYSIHGHNNYAVAGVSYMPKINGVTLKSDGALERLVNIGSGGIKTFFNDYWAIRECGFDTDDHYLADNYIVSDNHINMIDLEFRVSPILICDRERINRRAVHVILDGEDYDKKSKLYKELVGNTLDALSKVPNSTQATKTVKEMLAIS
jgi:hypothetical protein